MSRVGLEFLAAVDAVAAPLVADAVQEAVSGLLVGPQDPDAAVVSAVARLEQVHASDLDPSHLHSALAARFGADTAHHPAAVVAAHGVLAGDAEAHRVARVAFADDLGEAYRAPAGVRLERVQGVIDAERKRTLDRRRTRAARAGQRFLDAITLPESAYADPDLDLAGAPS